MASKMTYTVLDHKGNIVAEGIKTMAEMERIKAGVKWGSHKTVFEPFDPQDVGVQLTEKQKARRVVARVKQ